MGRHETRFWFTRGPSGGLVRHPYRAYVPHLISGWRPEFDEHLIAASEEAADALRSASASAAGASGLFFWAESVGSSHVEGLAPRPERVAAARLTAQATDSPADVAEVLGAIDATERAFASMRGRPGITTEGVREVHSMLMAPGPHPEIGGRFRGRQNWVGGDSDSPVAADHVPPPEESVPALMEDLAAFANRRDLPPLVLAALVHGQFEAIHPFLDGNGRTGRALTFAVLARRGCLPGMAPPISMYLAARKGTYIDALAAFHGFEGHPGDPARSRAAEPLIETFAAAGQAASAAVDAYMDACGAYRRAVALRAGRPRRGSTAARLLESITEHPSMSVGSVRERLKVSRNKAGAALRHLSAQGVLDRRESRGGLVLYEAPGVYRMFEAMRSNITEPHRRLHAAIAQAATREPPGRERGAERPAGQARSQCPKRVMSSGKRCGLRSGHAGYCRTAPRTAATR